jgi:group II intron reverse transcriptase/maturase
MAIELERIKHKASSESGLRFTSLYHHVTNPELLQFCFDYEIKPGSKPGIDGVTKKEYDESLEQNIQALSERLKRMGYRPQPVRRVYIPKAGTTKKRPLGMPTVEDKIVQAALTKVLSQIYEADFLDCSYGYRPQRGCHEALGELGRTIQRQKVGWVVEADIRGFFDHVNHEWLMKFLELRIGDPRVLRLIARFLKGGVMEDGLVHASEEGTPQGAILSPLLSNVYLHYVLDLWFERRFRKQCWGEAYFFRYADDFVACFQYREDAERFLTELKARLEQFHLEVEPSKTRLLQFGRFARQDAAQQGRQLEEFVFLGFTHSCGQTRAGSFKVQRRTSIKKYRAKLKDLKSWVRRRRHEVRAGELLREAKRRLQGHLNYYAITDNYRMCEAFRHQFQRLLFTWLNRRSQRRSYTWEQFRSALAWVGWPSVQINRELDPFRRVGLNRC